MSRVKEAGRAGISSAIEILALAPLSKRRYAVARRATIITALPGAFARSSGGLPHRPAAYAARSD